MALADDSIGFFLQLDNTLSPELDRAAKDYERFVKALDKWNTRAYTKASQGIAGLASLVESFQELPKQATKSYTEAIAKLKTKIKPLTQPLLLKLMPQAVKSLASAISAAVSRVLRRVKIRMSATAPIKKSAYFDTTKALRAQYKQEVQPPDMLGRFQGVPRYQKGGMVGGPGGIDEILALLTPGEMVLPADLVKQLQEAAGEGVPEATAQTLANIENLARSMEKLKDVADLGLDPNAAKKFNKGMGLLNEQLKEALGSFSQMKPELQKGMIPAMKSAKQRVEGFAEAGEEATSVFKNLLEKVLGAERFQAIHKALGSLQEGFSNVSSAAQNVGEQVGLSTEKFESFGENVNQVNLRLSLSRSELMGMRERLLGLGKEWAIGPTAMGEALEGLVEAGVPAGELLESLTPLAAHIGQTTTLSFDQAALQVAKLSDAYGWSEKQILSYFMTLKQQSAVAWVSMEELAEQGKELSETGFLAAFADEEAQKTALQNLSAVTAAMNSQWQATGKEFGMLFGKALVDTNVQGELAAIGARFEDVQQAVVSGDFSDVFASMARHLGGMTDKDQLMALTQFRETMKFPGTNEELLNIVAAGDKTVEMMGELAAKTIATDQAHEAGRKAREGALSGYERLKQRVGSLAYDVFPRWAMELADEVNPQLIISVGYLAKMGVEAAATGLKLFRGLGGALSAATAKLGLFGKVTKATTGTVAGPAGRGGIGQAISGFFRGIAQGIMALVPAIVSLGTTLATGVGALGFGALVVGLLAIAAAVRIASPALAIIADVLKAAISSVVDLVKVIGGMDPRQMLALGPALVMTGPGFAALGVGVLALGTSLALAAPGIAVFAGVMELLGGPAAAGGGLAGAISGLLTAFRVDQSALDAALLAVTSSAKFIVAFAGVSTLLAGLAVGAVAAGVVGKFLSFFGVKSPLEQLAAQAGSIGETIKGLVTGFTFSESELAQLFRVGDTLTAATALVGGYANVVQAVRGAGADLKTLAQDAPAVSRIIGAAFRTAVEATDLKQEMGRPMVARAEIQRLVTVALDPNTTDRPVHDAVLATNQLLHRLLTAVEAGGGLKPVPVHARGRTFPRARGSETRDAAEFNR